MLPWQLPQLSRGDRNETNSQPTWTQPSQFKYWSTQSSPRAWVRLPPQVAQKQGAAEGYQPYVPRVPEGIFLRGAIEGASEGKGQAEGDPGIQEGTVEATVQVRPVRVSYGSGEEKAILGLERGMHIRVGDYMERVVANADELRRQDPRVRNWIILMETNLACPLRAAPWLIDRHGLLISPAITDERPLWHKRFAVPKSSPLFLRSKPLLIPFPFKKRGIFFLQLRVIPSALPYAPIVRCRLILRTR